MVKFTEQFLKRPHEIETSEQPYQTLSTEKLLDLIGNWYKDQLINKKEEEKELAISHWKQFIAKYKDNTEIGYRDRLENNLKFNEKINQLWQLLNNPSIAAKIKFKEIKDLMSKDMTSCPTRPSDLVGETITPLSNYLKQVKPTSTHYKSVMHDYKSEAINSDLIPSFMEMIGINDKGNETHIIKLGVALIADQFGLTAQPDIQVMTVYWDKVIEKKDAPALCHLIKEDLNVSPLIEKLCKQFSQSNSLLLKKLYSLKNINLFETEESANTFNEIGAEIAKKLDNIGPDEDFNLYSLAALDDQNEYCSKLKSKHEIKNLLFFSILKRLINIKDVEGEVITIDNIADESAKNKVTVKWVSKQNENVLFLAK